MLTWHCGIAPRDGLQAAGRLQFGLERRQGHHERKRLVSHLKRTPEKCFRQLVSIEGVHDFNR